MMFHLRVALEDVALQERRLPTEAEAQNLAVGRRSPSVHHLKFLDSNVVRCPPSVHHPLNFVSVCGVDVPW